MSSSSCRTLLMVGGLIISLSLGSTDVMGQSRPRVTQTFPDLSSTLEATAQTVSAAVVDIFTTTFVPSDGIVPRNADLVTMQRASGSGVIVDSSGYIVTNAHVVRGAQRLRVELPVRGAGQSILARSGRSVIGQIVGTDPETDLAVIKVDAQDLPALGFGDSDELKAGQLVLAFGSPLGLQNSVSLGIVSAVARQLEPESPMIYIQTDASINPGSSGGPLMDLRGRIVGINTLIVSQAGRNEGLGFAAPSNIVRAVYEQIKKNGHVQRGDIGVRAQTVTPVLASGLNLARDYGVVLSDVFPQSPAAQAGLRPGDLVLSIDGKPLENGRQLQVRLYRRPIGDVVSLEIMRDSEPLKVQVTVSERQDPFAVLPPSTDYRENLVPRLGILGVNLDQRIAAMIPVQRVRTGVVVASTVDGAIDAREGGLAAGDIIYSVNRKQIQGLAELRTLIQDMKSGDSVVLQLERRGELMFLAFTVE